MKLFPTSVIAVILLLGSAIPALAGPKCTTEDRSKWMSEPNMKEKATASGIAIEVFKTTKGNCYEIYGRNAQGKRVEIYFDPVSGKPVKQDSL